MKLTLQIAGGVVIANVFMVIASFVVTHGAVNVAMMLNYFVH